MSADRPTSGSAVCKRLYIYRIGATDRCALTAVKNEPRLPPVAAPDCWRFWMQISPPQEQHRRYGFEVQSAVQAVVASGYHLFTGSAELLRDRPLVPSTPTSVAERTMADAAVTAYLFQCEGEDLYAVSHDITGSNIPRSPCTLGWRLCEEFQLARHLPVPAPILPDPILRGIADVGYYVWRGWSSGSSERPSR